MESIRDKHPEREETINTLLMFFNRNIWLHIYFINHHHFWSSSSFPSCSSSLPPLLLFSRTIELQVLNLYFLLLIAIISAIWCNQRCTASPRMNWLIRHRINIHTACQAYLTYHHLEGEVTQHVWNHPFHSSLIVRPSLSYLCLG